MVPSLSRRFDRFTEWMLSRSESRIIAVAHHGIFFEGLDIRLENCEVAQYELSKKDGWKLVQRQPGKGGPGEDETLTGPAPFPVGKPPVLQPQGLNGDPYIAQLSELLKATIPLTVIVIALLSVMFGARGEEGAAAGALR